MDARIPSKGAAVRGGFLTQALRQTNYQKVKVMQWMPPLAPAAGAVSPRPVLGAQRACARSGETRLWPLAKSGRAAGIRAPAESVLVAGRLRASERAGEVLPMKSHNLRV
jgi:hypothetical protein